MYLSFKSACNVEIQGQVAELPNPSPGPLLRDTRVRQGHIVQQHALRGPLHLREPGAGLQPQVGRHF